MKNPRPQYRVFGRSSDEESGEVWFTKEGTFPTLDEAKAFAIRAKRTTRRTHLVKGPGEPKPKDGYMSAEQQTRELRAAFDAMSLEERGEYLGQ